MKRNRLLNTIALAMCLGTLAVTSAAAQTLVVDRFGTQNGQLVAYGWIVPSESSSLSYIDESVFGGWTGIGTGYGESGVESRSNMLSSSTYDDRAGIDVRFGPTSGNDRVASGINLSVGPTSGNDRVASDLDVSMGATSGNDRTTIDARLGATSGNDRTQLDGNMGPTSANDRRGIDLSFGPTSGNDRVAGGPIDLKVGPTSANDRKTLDVHMGATSGNDRTSIDASVGPTSENDRTAIDLQVGPTSGNDRVASGVDVQMGPTSGNDRVATGIDLQVGPTSGNDRVASSSNMVVVPVNVIDASCDEVALSFAGSSEPVIVTSISSDDATRGELCAVEDVARVGDNVDMANQLNELIGRGS